MITSASVALAMASVSSVIAVPISKQASPLVARATIPTPAFVVYTDRFVSADVLPPVAELAVSSPQFAFLSHDLILRLSHRVGTSSLSPSSPPVEHSTRRVRLPRSLLMSVPQRQSTPTRASASLRSAFGETEKPTTAGIDPVSTATQFAQFVLDTGLDGIDVDYEDLDAINRGDGAAEQWVTTFTQILRQTLPQGQFILSHAPLAPWLSPNTQFAAGAYLTIHKNVGNLIDFVRLLLVCLPHCE